MFLLRSPQYPLVNIILPIILYMMRLCLPVLPSICEVVSLILRERAFCLRLCLPVLPSICEEALHILAVSLILRERAFCLSLLFLLPLIIVLPYVSSVHSHWSLLLLLLLHVVFDEQHWWIFGFSCVIFFYQRLQLFYSFLISAIFLFLCSLVKEVMSHYFGIWS